MAKICLKFEKDIFICINDIQLSCSMILLHALVFFSVQSPSILLLVPVRSHQNSQKLRSPNFMSNSNYQTPSLTPLIAIFHAWEIVIRRFFTANYLIQFRSILKAPLFIYKSLFVAYANKNSFYILNNFFHFGRRKVTNILKMQKPTKLLGIFSLFFQTDILNPNVQ